MEFLTRLVNTFKRKVHNTVTQKEQTGAVPLVCTAMVGVEADSLR